MEPNFNETLKFPDVFFDGRGQGKARNAAQKVGRFLVNSSIGIQARSERA